MLTINQQAADRLRRVAAANDQRARDELAGLPFRPRLPGDPVFADEQALGEDGRFYQPEDGGPIRTIEREDRRASCRECGVRIERGERAVVFGFQAEPHALQRRAARAFLHETRETCLLSLRQATAPRQEA